MNRGNGMYKRMLKYTKGNMKWYFFQIICLGIKSAEALISPLLVSKIIDQSISKGDIAAIIKYSIVSVVLYLSTGVSII